MGSKLILLLGLIVGGLLIFFCVHEDKRDSLLKYTKMFNSNNSSLLEQTNRESITQQKPKKEEPTATEEMEPSITVNEKENIVAKAEEIKQEKLKERELEKIELKKRELEKIELKKLKDTEDKIITLLKEHPIYFQTGSSTIKEKSKKELNQVVNALKSVSKNTSVLIKGHTDALGDALGNKKLSQKRANSVMLYLKKRGLDNLKMSAVGYGAEQPIVVNNPNDKRNRRVEIELKRGEE